MGIQAAEMVAEHEARVTIMHTNLARLRNLYVMPADVVVYHGGCIKSCKPMMYENPAFAINSITHCCVADMPGTMLQTTTTALIQVILQYVQSIRSKGWEFACVENQA